MVVKIVTQWVPMVAVGVHGGPAAGRWCWSNVFG